MGQRNGLTAQAWNEPLDMDEERRALNVATFFTKMRLLDNCAMMEVAQFMLIRRSITERSASCTQHSR
jgi:hypothetical protein